MNAAETLTFDRIFDDPSLYGDTAGRLSFDPSGKRIIYLRPSADDATIMDLWATDVATGVASPLLTYASLAAGDAVLSEEEKARRERQRIRSGGIVEYSWASARPDGAPDRLLVPVDGRLFVVDLGSDRPKVTQLTDATRFETDAKLSPDGQVASFVRGRSLFIQKVGTDAAVPFSPAGTDTVSYGLAEFIAQEEMHRNTGYWWSPDGQYIAYTMVDEANVDIIQRPEINASGTTLIAQRYPRAGTQNAIVRLFVAPIAQPEAYQEIDLGADTDIYLARVTWSADSSALYVQRQNREQTKLDVLKADIETGQSAIAWQEMSPTWINLHDDLKPLSNGQGLLWASERDGFKHLYLLNPDGKVIRPVTSGDWVVDQIKAVDEVSGDVYFTGRKDTPLEKHLYRVSYQLSGEPERLTEKGFWNTVTVAGDGKTFIANRSNPTQPPQAGLFDAEGDLIRWVTQNALDEEHPYFPYLSHHITPEYGTLEGPDGSTLYYELYLPPGEGKVPAVLEVYGGPGAQRVRRDFGALDDQVYAQSFALMRLDNRGSEGRGKAFEDGLHDAMGTVEVEDQKAALTFLQNHPRVKADKIGVMGWSYGGYMTLKMLMKAPDQVAAGVVGAPVTRWELYDTHYTERFLGKPDDKDGAVYEASNVFGDLDGLAAPMLLIHGMADDNVLLDHSTELMSALQSRNIQFETMLYPGQKHGFRGQAIRHHLERLTLDFLKRHLMAN